MTWNVQGETTWKPETIEQKIEFIRGLDFQPDVLMLQAVHCAETSETPWQEHLKRWVTRLSDIGLDDYVHTLDWAHELHQSNVQPHQSISAFHNRGNIIASSYPIERISLTSHDEEDKQELWGENKEINNFQTVFPEKILVGKLNLMNNELPLFIWNVGIVAGSIAEEEKINMLEMIYKQIYLQRKKAGYEVILGGDFNAPKIEETKDEGKPFIPQITPHGDNRSLYTDLPFYGQNPEYGYQYSFKERWKKAEQAIFDPAFEPNEKWGMKDTYWSPRESQIPKPSFKDPTCTIKNADPSAKRFDHILVSDNFDVISCEILNGEDGSEDVFEDNLSDHAPVVAELEVNYE